jgi:hypothetical protein
MAMGFIIGIGSGLASALLFYSASRGSPLLSTLLLLLTPLPSLIGGFGWGWLPALAGAAAGCLAMAFLASPTFAVGYFLALGAPVVLAAYLAYLSRPDPNDASKREWYPPGRLLGAMALYGGALPVLVPSLTGGSYGDLRAPMAEFLRRVSTRAAPEIGVAPLSPAQVEALADVLVAALPGAIAAYWLAVFTINLYLAGRIARASGRLGRDWPDLAAMTYPPGFPLLAIATLAASFVPGTVGLVGTSFSGSLLFAYMVAGLALMHAIARARAPWILWFVYAGLVLFGPYMALGLMLAGLLDPALQLRRRLGSARPPT